VLQDKQCRNCHAWVVKAGREVRRLTLLPRASLKTNSFARCCRGRGNMPAYGKNLSPAELQPWSRF
jgi:ubiquinol-cytochrome c reductase cytochrome b subunit